MKYENISSIESGRINQRKNFALLVESYDEVCSAQFSSKANAILVILKKKVDTLKVHDLKIYSRISIYNEMFFPYS